MSPVLRLEGVSKIYNQGQNQVWATREVNLEMAEGELVCLVGPSGSGKTTILQIAGLLDIASSGRIFIADQEVSAADDERRTEMRKKNIGFIYQFHHLMPELSVLENVALPLLIQGFPKKSAFERAKQILVEVELGDRINFKPFELSGGQQQRVAIARAIVVKPKLILADEPTGNLDSDLAAKIFALFSILVKSYKIACLVVSHNLELAKKCDRVLEIVDGKLSNLILS